MIIVDCINCGREFSCSASSCRCLCDDCDGTTDAKEKEAKRWKDLPLTDKIEELKMRIESLEQRNRWNGLIG